MEYNVRNMATETTEKKTKLQRAKELKEKYDALISDAKQEQMDIISAAQAELSEIGVHVHIMPLDEYRALVAQKPATRTASPKVKTSAAKPAVGPSGNFEPGKNCATCGIAGHDQRKHRTRKAKFTDAELTELGLQAPA